MTPVFAVHAPRFPTVGTAAEADAGPFTNAAPTKVRVAIAIADARTSFQLERWPFRKSFITSRSPEPRASRPQGLRSTGSRFSLANGNPSTQRRPRLTFDPRAPTSMVTD